MSPLTIRFKGKNPKKAGSAAYGRWALLKQHHGKTVDEFIEAGGNHLTLRNAIRSGYADLRKKR